MSVSDAVRERLNSVDWFGEAVSNVLDTDADAPEAGIHKGTLITRF